MGQQLLAFLFGMDDGRNRRFSQFTIGLDAGRV
jgi:hypothetical protein